MMSFGWDILLTPKSKSNSLSYKVNFVSKFTIIVLKVHGSQILVTKESAAATNRTTECEISHLFSHIKSPMRKVQSNTSVI